MACCSDFDQAIEDGVIVFTPAQEIADGPMMNEQVSEYYLCKPWSEGRRYYAINYCPFCGMPRSLAKQGFLG